MNNAEYSQLLLPPALVDVGSTFNLCEQYNGSRMTVKLSGIPSNTSVVRFGDDNPLAHNCAKTLHEVAGRHVQLGKICDYLIIFQYGNISRPVFFEISETCHDLYCKDKLEQLLCSKPIMDFYHSIADTISVHGHHTEYPRFVLIYNNIKKRALRKFLQPIVLHNTYPRVMARSSEVSAGVNIFHYGNSSNIIKVARFIQKENQRLKARDIFNVLSDPYPNQELEVAMKSICAGRIR